jgi:HSP20 family molecular chaperone IbpA
MKMRDQQELRFKTERMATNLNQSSQLKKLVEGHQEQLDVRGKDFRKGIREQDLFFEKKFKDQLERHEGDFRDLEKKNQDVVQKLKESLTKEIQKVETRNDDPFYKFEKLNPVLRQFNDRIEIEIKVPEYSKQDLQLSINGKEAIVSFNRRYHDASKAGDGTINKINKVESFTTRLKTDHHLDPKSVKARFQDGMMTYTVMKA